MKKIRVIVINPHAKEISEAHIEPKLDSFYSVIGCDLVEAFTPDGLDPFHFMYIDEEGALKQNDFWVFNGYPQPIAGTAILLKSDEEGGDLPCTMSIDEIRSLVAFIGRSTGSDL